MKKRVVCKVLYTISALLALCFAVSFGLDAYHYNDYISSAPLYAYAIARAFTFLLPSAVVLIIAVILKKTAKKG